MMKAALTLIGGIVIGIAVAAGATRVLENMLFGIAAADVGTFVGMSSAMILVGLLASYLPARRASNSRSDRITEGRLGANLAWRDGSPQPRMKG